MDGSWESRVSLVETKIKCLESLVEGIQQEIGQVGKSAIKKSRKPISEFKVIQSIAPLTDDKSKFREWNRKFANAMGQVDAEYETALLMIMKWADADAMSDMDPWQTVANRVTTQLSALNADRFGKDLKVCL